MMTSYKHTAALAFLLTFALAGQARAATKFPSIKDSGYDAKVLAKDRAAPKTTRKPSAAATVGEPDLMEDFKRPGGFRDQFLKITAAEGKDVGLAEFLDKDFRTYSPDVRFAFAQLQTVRP